MKNESIEDMKVTEAVAETQAETTAPEPILDGVYRGVVIFVLILCIEPLPLLKSFLPPTNHNAW